MNNVFSRPRAPIRALRLVFPLFVSAIPSLFYPCVARAATENSAPVFYVASLDEASAVTNSQIQPHFGATDPDGDPISYSFQWKKNGVLLPDETQLQLDLHKAGNGERGDRISCVIVASDGVGGIISQETPEITVQNSAPYIQSVLIGGSVHPNPTTNETLKAIVGSTDADSDTLTYSYVWKKNGVTLEGETGATLDLSKPGNGDKNDSIDVQVIADDGMGGVSLPKTSSFIPVISNTSPFVSNLTLDKGLPKTNDTLTASVTYSDEDNDPLTVTYHWVKNGVVLSGETGTTLDLSKPGNGDQGDIISCYVHVVDETNPFYGGLDGVFRYSGSVSVESYRPVITGVVIDNAHPATNSVVKANVFARDGDGDPLLYSYQWKKNDVVLDGETTDSLDLNTAGNGDNRDAISVVVSAFDGKLNSETVESQVVFVIDTAPSALVLSNASVGEQTFPGASVGVFSTTDIDADEAFIYSLVPGEGDDDNASFSIRGGELLTEKTFDFASQNLYHIRVKSRDQWGKSMEATFAISIVKLTHTPTATVSLSPSSPTTNSLLKAVAVGNDLDGDPVSFVYIWKNGNTVLAGEKGATLDLAKANTGNKGELITVTVLPHDGQRFGPSTVASVIVANSAPTLQAGGFTLLENTTFTSQLVGSDPDGDPLTYSIVGAPSGKLTLQSNGSFSYVPNRNWNGSDSFVALVRDSSGASTNARFTLTVKAVNNSPLGIADTVNGSEDVPLTIGATTLLKNDSNGEMVGEVDPLTITQVSVPSGFAGTLRFDASKQLIVFTPTLNWNGTTSFTYTLRDSTKATSTAKVTLKIAPVNDAPVALGGQLTVISGTVGEFALSGKDVDGDVLSFALSGAPKNGSAEVVKIGDKWVLRYASKIGFSGAEPLLVVARDAKVSSVPVLVSVTVKPNRAPQLVKLTPDKGSFAAGATVVFEQKVRDNDGTAHLDAAALLVSSSLTSANARGGAALWFDALDNRFTLSKDDGATTVAPVALGGTLENSQVKVTLGKGDVTRETNGTLTLKWHITFKSRFVGAKSLWGRVEDLGGLSAGFSNLGQITLGVSAQGVPSAPAS